MKYRTFITNLSALTATLWLLTLSFCLGAVEQDPKLGTSTKIVHARFISVNEFQTITLNINGAEYPIKLAYVRIPIKNEPYFERATNVIKDYFDKYPWVIAHLTGQKFFNGTIGAFITSDDGVNLNSILLAEGLAIPSEDAKKQETIHAIAQKAARHRLGIWSNYEAYKTLKNNSSSQHKYLRKMAQEAKEAVRTAGKYFAVDIETREYFHGSCYPTLKMAGRDVKVYVDKERLDELKYTHIKSCD